MEVEVRLRAANVVLKHKGCLRMIRGGGKSHKLNEMFRFPRVGAEHLRDAKCRINLITSLSMDDNARFPDSIHQGVIGLGDLLVSRGRRMKVCVELVGVHIYSIEEEEKSNDEQYDWIISI